MPVPLRMQHLSTDMRGYPIPYVVLIDKFGKPHFTVNDVYKQLDCVTGDLCHVCGKGLLSRRWFVGGPLSAFHPHGSYIDGAVHEECMHYALQVCPYLAAPNYRVRLDDKTLKYAGDEAFKGSVIQDNTMIPDRPLLFVGVLATGETLSETNGVIYHRPKRPYRKIEFWQHGEQLSHEAGYALAQSVLSTPIPAAQPAKVTVY